MFELIVWIKGALFLFVAWGIMFIGLGFIVLFIKYTERLQKRQVERRQRPKQKTEKFPTFKWLLKIK